MTSLPPLLIVYAVLAGLALLLAAALALQTYEHARFGRSRLRTAPAGTFQPRVEILIPCKGDDPEFEALAIRLFEQDYPGYGVTFIVESRDDPAALRVQRLLETPRSILARLLVAGLAQDCGQKVHNLLVATAALPAEAEVLAFVDSDVALDPGWLRRIVEPLENDGVGAVTGYRWFIPRDGTWASAALSALNGRVALLAGNHRWQSIWGGSWSIRRATFESAKIRESWQGAATEDLPAGRALRRAGLRIAFEPACLMESPTRTTWRSLAEFGRRQYLLARIHAPSLWWFALAGNGLFVLAFWGGLFLPGSAWMPLAVYALSILRGGMRASFANIRFPAERKSLARANHLGTWAQPLLAVCDLALLLSSLIGDTIVWRGIRYRVRGPHETEILSRASR